MLFKPCFIKAKIKFPLLDFDIEIAIDAQKELPLRHLVWGVPILQELRLYPLNLPKSFWEGK